MHLTHLEILNIFAQTKSNCYNKNLSDFAKKYLKKKKDCVLNYLVNFV